jgi:cysteine desulfurase
MSKRIYLDYAATTPIAESVWEAMSSIRSQAYGNPSSVHSEGRIARTIIEEARKSVARHIGASLTEVFFTSCGTESNNMILIGAVRDLGVTRILTSPTEHHCILHTCEFLSTHHDVQVEYLPVNQFGQIESSALSSSLEADKNQKTLVSLMHVNNETGVVQDLVELGAICRKNGALFHSDTVQSVGFEKIDLNVMPLDFMVGSAHKLYGPKGAGFVYIRSDHQLKPMLFGGGQERNMRSGTENILGIHGLKAAIDLSDETLEGRIEYLNQIRSYFRNALRVVSNEITFNGPELSGYSPKILSVNFPPGPRSDLLLMHLDINGISASGGSACSSGVETPSHVLSHLNIPANYRTVRFSFSTSTTKEEIDRVIEVLISLYKS